MIKRYHADTISEHEEGSLVLYSDHLSELTRLRAALEFYADYRTYADFPGDNMCMLIEQDEGQIARTALGSGSA